MKKNRTVLACTPGHTSHWIYRIELQGPKSSDVYNEMKNVIETLFEAFDDLVYPLSVEYTLIEYPKGTDIADIFEIDHTWRRHSIYPTNPSDIHRLSAEELFDEFDTVSNGDGDRTLFSLSTSRAETKIHLDRGDVFVSRGDEEFVIWTWEGPKEPTIRHDPIEVDVRIRRPTPDSDSSLPYCEVVIRTTTDIWFEQSPNGRVNRDRLASRLVRLAKKLNPWDTHYYGEQFKEDTLRDRGIEELLPTEW